jgi:hypothetical protein
LFYREGRYAFSYDFDGDNASNRIQNKRGTILTEGICGMSGANANEPLDLSQEQLTAGQELPPVPDQAEIGRSIDNVEERRTALDQELAQMRAAGQPHEQQMAPQEAGTDRQADIDRALALDSEGRLPTEPTPEEPSPDDSVAPERWTDRGGMVEQQASAMEWLEHSNEVRQERAAGQEYKASAQELSAEDRELLDAARTTEAQTQQQELAQSHVHEPSSP